MPTLQKTKQQQKLQAIGESIASAVSQRLQPNFRLEAHPENDLEWQIFDLRGVYCGGYCYDGWAWFQVCAPLPGSGHTSDVPFIPDTTRQAVRGIVWDAIGKANGGQ